MKTIFKKTFITALLFLTASPFSWAMAKRPPVPVAETEPAKPKRVLTLSGAYELALRRSEVIAMKREEIAKTRAAWLKASGEMIGDGDFLITDFLQDAQGGGGSTGGSVGSTLSAKERRERKFVFSQPLFQGFKSLGAITGAGSLTRQRTEEHLRAKELLFLEVVDAFYGLRQQKKDLETFEGIHQLFQERTSELNDRIKVGRSRSSELSTANAKMRILEAQMAQAHGALTIAESLMEFYTGIPSGEAVYKEEKIPTKEITEPAQYELLADGRSDVEAAKQAAKTARQAVIVAQSELWPKITLDSNHYEKREGFQSDIDWDVLFKINVPLFRGGETMGEVKETYSEWKQAKLNYSYVKRQAELEIKESYQNWAAALQQNKAFREAVKAAQENYRFQKEDYGHSLVNNLDVLEALEELFNTSKEANRVFYDMKRNYWRYQTAVGQCCEVPDQTPAPQINEKRL